MRKILILVWLLVPVGALAFHMGPGQKQMLLDNASVQIRQAEQFVADEKWAEAVEAYERALTMLPDDQLECQRKVRLEKAKAQMFAAQLPAASDDLKALVDELMEEKDPDSNLLKQARSSMANSQYYRTWLMRLEGLPREVWEPEIESARQTYKLLVEQAKDAADEAAKNRYQEDLESTIRLARMDLSDLQGLPLPSQ